MTDADGGVDATTPNVARMYDYWLGGKDNFEPDRVAAERVVEISEGRVIEGVRLNRLFLGTAVSAAAAAGVRQFLDLGSGLPTQDNVHDVALRARPDARVVYVDNDPMVCVHGRALLGGVGQVGFVEGDLRRPEEILGDPAVRSLLDLTEPVAVLCVSVLHFVGDAEATAAVTRVRDAMAPGSRLILSHLASDAFPGEMAKTEQIYSGANARLGARPRAQILRFFDGFELLPPGLVGPTEWLTKGGEPGGRRFAGLVGVGAKH
ncbi:SAM-dependent methyltransferase [Spirillospora sp. CA-294931]|uniref:SAM-dependent methyltransferase n=1 Tax=Spirillospora sp. CA-294931 TaxID=3240042 RepID=UPI003D937374